MIDSKKYDKICRTFFEKISEDKNIVDMKLIASILLTFLSADYLKGLQVGMRYAEAMLSQIILTHFGIFYARGNEADFL